MDVSALFLPPVVGKTIKLNFFQAAPQSETSLFDLSFLFENNQRTAFYYVVGYIS